MRYLVVFVAAAGCARASELGDGGNNSGGSDAAVAQDAARSADAAHAIDAPHAIDAAHAVDAAPAIDAAPPTTAHILLSEVALTPNNGGEFVEIVNPTSASVDLSHYYLANHGSYYQLPSSVTLPSGHWIVQFPAGSSLAAGAVITVATSSASAFNAIYGVSPTYSISDNTVTKTQVSGTPSLTDTGAFVVLFDWDGTAPLVKDVDMMIVGVPTSTNQLMSKSGASQGGGTYATDANTIAAQPSAPASGTSTKRLVLETGHETQAGTGNGITGHDETSEDTAVTWDTTFTAPTPGTVPATL